MGLIGTVAFASIVKAPQDSLILANELVTIEDNSISALVNGRGIGVNEPKYLIGLYAAKYGVSYDELSKVIQCESGFDHLVCEHGGYCDNGKAYGIAQFHHPTFKAYCTGNYYDMEDQIRCMTKMFSVGEQSHWSCY